MESQTEELFLKLFFNTWGVRTHDHDSRLQNRNFSNDHFFCEIGTEIIVPQTWKFQNKRKCPKLKTFGKKVHVITIWVRSEQKSLFYLEYPRLD